MDVHIPNVGMLDMGAKSMIVAAGVLAVTVGAEDALNVAGAAPKVQAIMAPVTTSCPIQMPLLMLSNQTSRKILLMNPF
jgi:hypothetical protein